MRSANRGIPRSTIDEVRLKADILAVIGRHVPLRKSGRDHKGLCPFHEERHPSFYVSPSKGIFKCFSCGASGDVLDFVIKHEGLSFNEAVVELAQDLGVQIEYAETASIEATAGTAANRQLLLAICEAAADFYEASLWAGHGEEARQYLQVERGLDERTIRHFRLGFAPNGWTALTDHMLRIKKASPEQLEAAGLSVNRASGQGHYDRFRGRLMIPISDARGRVIAFAGRSLDGSEPKYLNSPETELFSKSQVLYALDKARGAIAREGEAVVVEGYFDAIALHRAGIHNTVAAMGTALGSDQVSLLLRFTPSKRLVLAFDGDEAGAKATERATEELLPLLERTGGHLAVLVLEGAKDADEFLRTRLPEEFRALVSGAADWFAWRSARVMALYDPTSHGYIENALGLFAALLSLPMDSAVREGRVREVATRLARGGGGLTVKLEDALRRRSSTLHPRAKPQRLLEAAPPSLTPRYRAEAQILTVYLGHPELRKDIHAAQEQFGPLFEDGVHSKLWAVLDLEYQRCADVSDAIGLLKEALVNDGEGLTRLEALLWPKETGRGDLERPAQTIQAVLAVLLIERFEAELGQLGALCNEAEARGDWEETARLMGLHQKQAVRIRDLHALIAFRPP